LIAERVDSETASHQLGHSSPAITREFYIAKPAIAADVAHVLQTLAEPVERPRGANTSGIRRSGARNETAPDPLFRRSGAVLWSG
jgi:hypothetical protein